MVDNPVVKIAAVIVTHNRKALLKRCVKAVRNQSVSLDLIIVVNNGSADGTAEWLAEEPGLHVIHQVNLGSAGGQYVGMKAAYDSGADLIWCMDDDGVPGQNCLDTLVHHSMPGAVISPVPRDIDNPQLLAFNMMRNGSRVSSLEELRGTSGPGVEVLEGYLFPFNGVVVSREILESVGYPNPSMFIWGDETEWASRCNRSGVGMHVALYADYFHPRERVELLRVFYRGRATSIPWCSDPERRKILLRNFAWNARQSAPSAYLLSWRLTVFCYLVGRSRGVMAALSAARYMSQGVRGIVGRGDIARPLEQLRASAKEYVFDR
jgi:rhamnopyranosyl-N-acetylglucosaminyl-diphospho-decaprenol beta-1,3/1,4-galactofuranosyltransferase